ncbi:hypothetical protein ACQJBY_000209 [Aegilops geniculata]
MASSTGVAPPSSPDSPAVGHGIGQRLKTIEIKESPKGGDTTPTFINPLLLASACLGSSAALHFLFEREDKQEPPMLMPTQVFLDKLVGYIPGSSNRRTLALLPASNDVEGGVDHPVLPLAACTSEDIEDGVHQAALHTTTSHNEEDGVDARALPAAAPLLNGVTVEGDTALHAVASHGDSAEFLDCASIIDRRDNGLLFVVNQVGDTPLHCAAKAGRSQMLCRLIELARSRGRLHKLLRRENKIKETALHDAIRIGNKDIVEHLLMADPNLANYPEKGTSPLYLAILLERDIIAHTLHNKTHGNLSYCGPRGKNALHAAAFRGTGITKLVLKWNNSLTTHGDRDGSTPLHLASSFKNSISFTQLFEANPAPVYKADNTGLFPVHVAASAGAKNVLQIILEKFPSSARLRTSQGRTFLHVAVEKRKLNIVSFVCQTPSLAWILNMQDNDGNTALHLAIKAPMLQIFCSLYGNKEVHLTLTNNKEETPIDLSRNCLPRGMYYHWNNEKQIYATLALFGTNHNGLRWDQFEEKYSRHLTPEDKVKEAEKVKDSSQILGIGSVLIATVAFGATFAVPGGFIADDHTNRGTPTLARRYTFDAFMMANALAFICSIIATVGLMFSGTSMVNMKSRQINLYASVFFMSSSLTSLSVAFATGVYMVLAPVAHATAMVICVLSPLAVLYRNSEFLLKVIILARSLYLRMGIIWALKWLAMMMVKRILLELWPFTVIFGWAAVAQKIRNHL